MITLTLTRSADFRADLAFQPAQLAEWAGQPLTAEVSSELLTVPWLAPVGADGIAQLRVPHTTASTLPCGRYPAALHLLVGDPAAPTARILTDEPCGLRIC